jgi:hypothetical protein
LKFQIAGKILDKKSFSDDKDLRDSIKLSKDVTLDFTIRKS